MKHILILLLIFAVSKANAESCSVCQNGEDPNLDFSGCSSLVSKAALTDTADGCDSIHLESFQLRCCEAPQGICTLCPDGSEFDLDQTVPNINRLLPDTTCIDLNGQEEFLGHIYETGTCDDTILRRSASWCGCPGVPNECTLCDGGAAPTKPDRVEKVLYGWTCDFFGFAATLFDEAECTNLVTGKGYFKMDPAAYCGCPNTSSPNLCNLCKAGEVVYESKVLSRGYTCGELASSVSYINNQNYCFQKKTEFWDLGYIDECCINLDDGDKSKSATVKSINIVLLVLLCFSVTARFG